MSAFMIRPPVETELDELLALNIRSKAYWGYDAEFMDACRDELTVTARDVANSAAVVVEIENQISGMAQVGPLGEDADLLKLFIDPPHMGTGLGRHLFNWCVSAAREDSKSRLLIEADPQAAPFYEHMGARIIGTTPSGSIPGRSLPLLEYSLR